MEWLEYVKPWLLPLFTALITFLLYRRKYLAEVDSTLVNTASRVVDLYGEAFTELEQRVRSLERENDRLRRHITEIEEKHNRQHLEDRRRMRLLAKVTVNILDVCNGGSVGIDEFITSVKASCEDMEFLREIIDEELH